MDNMWEQAGNTSQDMETNFFKKVKVKNDFNRNEDCLW